MLSFELSPEQEALKENVARFTRERIVPVAAEHDQDSSFPVEVIREAWELACPIGLAAIADGAAEGPRATFLRCDLARFRLIEEAVSGGESRDKKRGITWQSRSVLPAASRLRRPRPKMSRGDV